MRTIITALVLALLVADTPRAAAQELTRSQAQDEAANWRRVADVTPLGSRIKVETTDRRRYSGTLMEVTDTAIVFKRATRLPEPPVTVPFDRIERIERDHGGLSVAKAIGVGLAAGAGAVASLILLAIAMSD